MDRKAELQIKVEADDLAERIVKAYDKYGVNIDLKPDSYQRNRFIFSVKIKGNTQEKHIRAYAIDVQLRLKLPLFQVVKEDLTLYIIASTFEFEYPHLSTVLRNPNYQTALAEAKIPYIVGHDAFGDLVIEDLAKFPHLLLGGSTNSGKTVGLQALIASIAYTKSPSWVNFILIDAGATDLLVFEKLPHLSCPIVQNRTMTARTLNALISEMERRITLEHSNILEFLLLPRLVVVIDEFPALFLGIEKTEKQFIIDSISSLLQRGRHAKIHLVLAAQNPTFQNMKVDLGNITARIAFKCAKKNFSEVILGEGGAEKLSGQGEMLLKNPAYDLQRLQGTYATEGELAKLVKRIIGQYGKDKGFSLKIPDARTESTGISGEKLTCSVVRKGLSKEDQLLADVIVWALRLDTISVNMLMTTFHLGWNKAAKLIQRLEELGIVDGLKGKCPREVIPSTLEEIPDELVQFLEANGYEPHSYAENKVVEDFLKDILSE